MLIKTHSLGKAVVYATHERQMDSHINAVNNHTYLINKTARMRNIKCNDKSKQTFIPLHSKHTDPSSE